MEFSEIHTALESIGVFQLVDMASDIDTIGDSTDRAKLPAAFYHPWQEQSAGAESLDAEDQLIKTVFGIKIVARNSEIEAIKKQVRTALIGLRLPNATTKTEFNNGQVIDVHKSLFAWRDYYSFTAYQGD